MEKQLMKGRYEIMLLIKNGKVKTMVSSDLENGCILIGDDGRILSVGEHIEENTDITVIDACGRLVTP
jgi:imidazolonepropionase-like amidohydrolase